MKLRIQFKSNSTCFSEDYEGSLHGAKSQGRKMMNGHCPNGDYGTTVTVFEKNFPNGEDYPLATLGGGYIMSTNNKEHSVPLKWRDPYGHDER